jgi:hypothetical protein
MNDRKARERKSVTSVLDAMIAGDVAGLPAEAVRDLMSVRAVVVDMAEKLDTLVRLNDDLLQEAANYAETPDPAMQEHTIAARQSFLRFHDLALAKIKVTPELDLPSDDDSASPSP